MQPHATMPQSLTTREPATRRPRPRTFVARVPRGAFTAALDGIGIVRDRLIVLRRERLPTGGRVVSWIVPRAG